MMKILDARRLTGLNIDIDGPGVMAEVDFGTPEARESAFEAFKADLAVFMPEARPVMRPWADGGKASISFEAPIDRLYATVALAETLLGLGASEPSWREDPANVAALLAIHEGGIAEESVPALRVLEDAARQAGVPFLWDDDEVSLGFGASALIFPARQLPEPQEISDFTSARFRDLPKVIITGTNGKTTTSRMTTRILKTAGLVVGASSTDALTVDEVIIDKGDWTGPGAARRILRHPKVTAAVLETARGGLLRRGLGVVGVDAAAVTNVGDDHFGDHGIVDLAGMAKTKATVWRAVRPGGRRLVNADCDPSFQAALDLVGVEGGGAELPAETWILSSLDKNSPRIQAHLSRGGEAWFVSNDAICRAQGDSIEVVMPAAEMPASWGGSARHNVANALVAGALACALGLTTKDVAAGLRTFGASVDDNPGRAERWQIGDVTVALDFGHNAHGLSVLVPMIRALREGHGRLAVSIAQAGDRSEEDLATLIDGVLAFEPALVVVRPLPGYERGRQTGEVEALLKSALVARQVPSDAVKLAASEVDALDQELAWAEPGDVILHLVHVERPAVRAWLAAHGATT